MEALSQYSDDQLAQIAGGMPAPIDKAILGQESGGKTTSPTSIDGAIGPSQVIPATFARFAQPGEDIHNDADNLAVGQRYRDYLSKRFDGDPARIATAYFSGEGNVAPAGSATPWIKDKADGNGKSVSSYVSDIMGRVGNAIIPGAEAAEPSPASSLSDEDLQKIAQTGGSHEESPAPAAAPAEGSNVSPSFVKQWLSNIGENASDAATHTGEAMSEGGNPKAPHGMQTLDSIVRNVAKVGNVINGAFGMATAIPGGTATTAVEDSGVIPKTAQAVKKNLVPTDPRFTADISPDNQHQVARSIGADLNNVLMLALSAKNAPTGEVPPPDSAVGAPPAPPGAGSAQYQPPGGLSSLMKDQSSGGPGFTMPEVSQGEPVEYPSIGNFFKDSSSIPPKMSHADRYVQSIPESVKTTDGGQPLLVTAPDIKLAQKDIQPFMQNDGVDLYKVADQLEAAQKINPNVRALDVMAKDEGGIPGGSNMVALAKSIAQSPGQGKTLAAEMTNRGYTASARIGDAFDESISKAPYYKVQNDSIQQMQGTGDLYTKAYAANKDISSPVINRLLKTNAGQKALSFAANRMNTKMSLMGVPDAELAEQAELAGQAATGGISKGLKLQTYQYVKEGYDNQISSALASGEKGLAKDLIEQKNGMVGELDKIDKQTTGGLYAQARSTYATAAQAKDALEQGRGFMKMDPEEIEAFIKDKNTSNPEKVAFVSGVRRALQDKIDTHSEATNPINQLWKPNLQKRLQPLFPTREAYDAFAANMEHEKTMARVNGIMQGSPTHQNQAFSQTPAKSILGNSVRALDVPDFVMNKTADFIDRALQERAKGMSQNSKTVIMRYLTTKDPDALRDLAVRIGQKPVLDNKP